jgi:transposase
MAKYSLEEKMNAVLQVTEKHLSLTAISNSLGCDRKLVQRWVKRYEKLGAEGLARKSGTYTGEFKQHVVEYMHTNNLPIAETAAMFGIPSDTTLSIWERIYYEEGPLALYRDNRGRKKHMSSDKPKKEKLTKETEEDLIAEVQRLRMENAYLKKLNALVQERIAREDGKKLPPSEN